MGGKIVAAYYSVRRQFYEFIEDLKETTAKIKTAIKRSIHMTEQRADL